MERSHGSPSSSRAPFEFFDMETEQRTDRTSRKRCRSLECLGQTRRDAWCERGRRPGQFGGQDHRARALRPFFCFASTVVGNAKPWSHWARSHLSASEVTHVPHPLVPTTPSFSVPTWCQSHWEALCTFGFDQGALGCVRGGRVYAVAPDGEPCGGSRSRTGVNSAPSHQGSELFFDDSILRRHPFPVIELLPTYTILGVIYNFSCPALPLDVSVDVSGS